MEGLLKRRKLRRRAFCRRVGAVTLNLFLRRSRSRLTWGKPELSDLHIYHCHLLATMDRGENEGGEKRGGRIGSHVIHDFFFILKPRVQLVASNSSKAKAGSATAAALTKAVLITICADEIEPHLFQKISARWREAWLKFEVSSLFDFVWPLGDK